MPQVIADSNVAGSPAIVATSVVARAVEGHSTNEHGVVGKSTQGAGVFGRSENSRGVQGHSNRDHAVVGESIHGSGVLGVSENSNGIEGRSTREIGIFGKGGRLAALFDGDVEVTGDIRLSNADCAEDFDVDIDAIVEPGTVMVIREEGVLRHSEQAFDKRVAGVISGAGGYKPGVILDTHKSRRGRHPIALLGKVFCKVDAQFGAIEVGDLLTTSSTPGHAMKTINPAEAFGAVIGKALRPFREGTGLIPILIALQ